MARKRRVVVGVISDTHGLLRPEAAEALRGSDLVLHAGDVGGEAVLDALRAIAPVVAVRGNNDKAPWAFGLPAQTRVDVGGLSVHLLHDVSELAFEPKDEGVAAVVFGHSHRPAVDRRDGVLWLNPGSAGPLRFKLPVCVARMVVERGAVSGELVVLDDRGKRGKRPKP